jgi:hypothetical protein
MWRHTRRVAAAATLALGIWSSRALAVAVVMIPKLSAKGDRAGAGQPRPNSFAQPKAAVGTIRRARKLSEDKLPSLPMRHHGRI